MNTSPSVRTETEAGVRSIILCRPAQYNTITPDLRDELAAAIDEADVDTDVRVMLLKAEGPAFCAGYGLDWSTEYQAAEAGSVREMIHLGIMGRGQGGRRAAKSFVL